MTDPYLIPCLKTLRSEFNELNPSRDKGSDGWIGDAKHQSETSDHNPDSQGRVLAIDIDSTGPWPAPFGDVVESLRGDSRLEYIIWNRRIASRSQGWTWRTYTGTSDPHTGHAHFSARHDHTGQNSTAPWGLEDFMPLSDSDIDKIAAATEQRIAAHTEQDPATGENNYRIFGAIRTMNEKLAKLQATLDAIKGEVDALTPPSGS